MLVVASPATSPSASGAAYLPVEPRSKPGGVGLTLGPARQLQRVG